MLNPSDPEDSATVRFTADEAIVLFELLWRWSDRESASETPDRSCFESTAEGVALNSLRCELERQLAAPFRQDYVRILKEARDRLAASWDYPTLRG